MAKFHFKYGAMNSGKSDALIKTAYNYTENNLNIVVVKPLIDVKGGKYIISRGGGKRIADILLSEKADARKAIKLFAKEKHLPLSCVLVDEAQFLSEKQVDQLFMVAKVDNLSVIAYGLRSDFKTKLFSGSKRLFELCDQIEKIPTMCSCGSQAEFNCRVLNGEFIFNGSKVAIDGQDQVAYKSLCGKCYASIRKKH
jgi:thymidine kinase